LNVLFFICIGIGIRRGAISADHSLIFVSQLHKKEVKYGDMKLIELVSAGEGNKNISNFGREYPGV
jgi:hypothetical protein